MQLDYNEHFIENKKYFIGNKNMKIILLGCPGSGKGTQAKFLSDYFEIPIISTGALLRDCLKKKEKFYNEIQRSMLSGKLVSDDIVVSLLNKRLYSDDCKDGFILDGFPRTINQADELNKQNIDIDYVIALSADPELIIDRFSGRRTHTASGRVYHTKYNPPKINGIDDITGEKLVQREDDIPSTIKKRIKDYNDKTKSLLEYYKNLSSINICSGKKNILFSIINASDTIENVKKNIFNLFLNV